MNLLVKIFIGILLVPATLLGMLFLMVTGTPFIAYDYYPTPSVEPWYCTKSPDRHHGCPADKFEGWIDTPVGPVRMYLTPHDVHGKARSPYTIYMTIDNLLTDYSVSWKAGYDARKKKRPDLFDYMLIDRVHITSSLGKDYMLDAEQSWYVKKVGMKPTFFPIRLDADQDSIHLAPALPLAPEDGEVLTIRMELRYFARDTQTLVPFVLETTWSPEMVIKAYGGISV